VIVNTGNVIKDTIQMSHQTAGPVHEAIEARLVLIRKALEDRNLTKVAQSTGLHENTVRNIAKGRGGIPLLATIDKLSQYLFAQNA
jgi:hypothetical protein